MSSKIKLSETEIKINKKIEDNKHIYIQASHDISTHPELQNQEFYAQELLTKILAEQGFVITKNIAGHETGFIAEKASSTNKPGPSIAFLAEYDALPDIGHGCGHNIIGTLSSLAAVGLSEVLEETGGKIFVYGTPAEEGGDNGSAKGSFVDAGLFQDIDVAMLIHPSYQSCLTSESLAVKCYAFEFFGKPAHASGSPQDGVNALDAMISFFNGIALLRQQTTPDTRIHGIITDGGTAPNVIPDYTKAKFYIRGLTKSKATQTLERVIKVAEGAATATGCRYKATKFNNDVDDVVVNEEFDYLFQKHAEKVGISYEYPEGDAKGSSDVGNVSYAIPVIQPTIGVTQKKIPSHTVEFANACVSTLGDEGLVNGAKALAYTALQLLTDRETLERIKNKHRQLLGKTGEDKN